VVGTQDPLPGGENVAELVFGLGVLALLGHHMGDRVPGGQRVGVVGAQDPLLDDEVPSKRRN
jgi:hypothetical protein